VRVAQEVRVRLEKLDSELILPIDSCPLKGRTTESEPPRVCRRLQLLSSTEPDEQDNEQVCA